MDNTWNCSFFTLNWINKPSLISNYTWFALFSYELRFLLSSMKYFWRKNQIFTCDGHLVLQLHDHPPGQELPREVEEVGVVEHDQELGELPLAAPVLLVVHGPVVGHGAVVHVNVHREEDCSIASPTVTQNILYPETWLLWSIRQCWHINALMTKGRMLWLLLPVDGGDGNLLAIEDDTTIFMAWQQ